MFPGLFVILFTISFWVCCFILSTNISVDAWGIVQYNNHTIHILHNQIDVFPQVSLIFPHFLILSYLKLIFVII